MSAFLTTCEQVQSFAATNSLRIRCFFGSQRLVLSAAIDKFGKTDRELAKNG